MTSVHYHVSWSYLKSHARRQFLILSSCLQLGMPWPSCTCIPRQLLHSLMVLWRCLASSCGVSMTMFVPSTTQLKCQLSVLEQYIEKLLKLQNARTLTPSLLTLMWHYIIVAELLTSPPTKFMPWATMPHGYDDLVLLTLIQCRQWVNDIFHWSIS